MLRTPLLTLLSSVLLLGLIVSADEDLGAICLDRPVELRKISRVLSLIEQSKQSPVAACAKYQNSFNDLEDILRFVQTGKTCDLALVDKIRKYQQKYLVQDGELAPAALRQFFLALGFQISAECKIVMINNFEADIASRFSEEDYAIFNLLEKNGANPLSEEQVADYDDIILAKEFYAGLDMNGGVATKLLVKVQTSELVHKLTNECRTKFKPIYDTLIMPLIELSNLGYNYQGEMLDRELAELRQNKFIHRWYNILQTCEAFDALEIFQDPRESSTGRKAITLISKSEASSLQRVDTEAGEQPIVYEAPISHNSDELWILNKQELDKLIQKSRASASEVDRIRSKIFKKMMTRVKEAFKRGELISSSRNGMDDLLQPFLRSDDLVSNIDTVVSNETSDDTDTAVSGGRGKTNHKGGKPRGRSSYGVPPKPTFIPTVENGTKTSTWFWDATIGKLAPSRSHIFMWTICSAAMIVNAFSFLKIFG